MCPDAFNLDGYLARLNYSAAVQPTEDGLEGLHRAQFYSIPFENFDILLGRRIDLEPSALFDKLVSRRRGGYCFELNGLFLLALKAIGFNARALLARVHTTGTPSGRGHQITLVSIADRDWVADVGFGNPYLHAPIPLEVDRPSDHGGRTIRLTNAGHFGMMLQAFKAGRWQDLYSFDLQRVYPGDIAYGNHYSSTHPNSFFTYARTAILPSPNGAVTLFNQILKKRTGEVEQVQSVKEGQAYLDALKTHFGIELDAPYGALRPLSKTDLSHQFKEAFPELG
jgi:N-hydroxyarylamine O-acetyltransferase